MWRGDICDVESILKFEAIKGFKKRVAREMDIN
jgi:hypothetical protein